VAEMSLNRLAAGTGGRILRGSPELLFRRYAIDSRLIQPGDLFFAILGDRDGHDFAADALHRGAGGVVVMRDIPLPDSSVVLMVDDTLAALQQLAHGALRESGTRVIGITGSIGKTTTKEFTHTLLSRELRVHKSEKSFNNHLGLPLSLLDMSADREWAVLEYGMNHPGEIAELTRIAAPDVAVITNIHPVHMEFFQDLRDIAAAKRELLEGMNPKGTAVLNHDNPMVRELATASRGKIITFGIQPGADITLGNLKRRGWDGVGFELHYGSERIPISLPFFNEGFISNFLAAAATARIVGISPGALLEGSRRLEVFSDRGSVLRLGQGIRLVNDSYNSNPVALEAALRALNRLPGGRKVAVLGDMLELGSGAGGYHRSAGRLAAKLGIDLLITIGPLSQGMAEGAREAGMDPLGILSFADSEQAGDAVPSLLRKNDIVLVKASRGIHIEKLIEKIKGKG
jgi:UDP-N-acetylmuramoyl-tripeptide--D-alanyl-D-alanine ligase